MQLNLLVAGMQFWKLARIAGLFFWMCAWGLLALDLFRNNRASPVVHTVSLLPLLGLMISGFAILALSDFVFLNPELVGQEELAELMDPVWVLGRFVMLGGALILPQLASGQKKRCAGSHHGNSVGSGGTPDRLLLRIGPV